MIKFVSFLKLKFHLFVSSPNNLGSNTPMDSLISFLSKGHLGKFSSCMWTEAFQGQLAATMEDLKASKSKKEKYLC